MSTAPSCKKLFTLAVGYLLLGLVPALSQQLDHGFMPKGGKTLLLEFLGSAASDKDVRAIIEARRSEPEWRKTMERGAKGGLSEIELRTLAAYLATNMPVAGRGERGCPRPRSPMISQPPCRGTGGS